MPARVSTVATVAAAMSLAALGLGLAGCARSTLLVHTSTEAAPSGGSGAVSGRSSHKAPGPSPARYLSRLLSAQQTLARAEARLPASAPTPQALAHSVTLLAGAVQRLERRLQAITPPASVARQHATLIAIMGAYAGRLLVAARIAVTPGGEVRAGTMLISATSRASTNFSSAIAKIYSTLGVRRP